MQFISSRMSEFRTCTNCCSLAGQQGWLCDFCAPAFESQRYQQNVRGYPHFVLSLYQWTSAYHVLNQRVIYELKGSGTPTLYELAAFKLWLLRQSLGLWTHGAPTVIVPSPGRREQGDEMDHAELLADQLSRMTGFELIHALERVDKTKQRKKTRLQRLSGRDKKFKLRADVDIKKLQGQVVFVDDLVTTGATADAAYAVMGQPQHFEVWTLMHKPEQP